jgi:hypothetical protein
VLLKATIDHKTLFVSFGKLLFEALGDHHPTLDIQFTFKFA